MQEMDSISFKRSLNRFDPKLTASGQLTDSLCAERPVLTVVLLQTVV